MSIQSEIDRIEKNIEKAYTALLIMGAEIPPIQNSENLESTICSMYCELGTNHLGTMRLGIGGF